MSRTIVHRVVFYDLLSNPERERQIDANRDDGEPPRPSTHLSIPIVPGLESVWAPNGYGKTFAMLLLERLRFPSGESDASVSRPQYWLGQFLKEAYQMVREPSSLISRKGFLEADVITADRLSNWRADNSQRMIPFSRMMIRFVTLSDDDEVEGVEDLHLEPNWEAGAGGADTPTSTYLYETRAGEWNGQSPHSEIRDWELPLLLGATPEMSVPEEFFPSPEIVGFFARTLQNLEELNMSSDLDFEDSNHGTTECNPPAEHLNPSNPPEGFFISRTHELLETLRCLRVKYVEVPEVCHGAGSDSLDECQKLISGLISVYGDFDRRASGEKTVPIKINWIRSFEERHRNHNLGFEVDFDHPAFKQIRRIFENINAVLGGDENDPWSREVVPGTIDKPMVFRRTLTQDVIDPETLSFGQRSAIVTECWLGFLESESQQATKYDLNTPDEVRYCLILDEPESGRGEEWTRKLIERLIESAEGLSAVPDRSLIVLSHRHLVLSSIVPGGKFHLMQPYDETLAEIYSED